MATSAMAINTKRELTAEKLDKVGGGNSTPDAPPTTINIYASDPSTFGLGASGEPVHNPLQACLFGA